MRIKMLPILLLVFACFAQVSTADNKVDLGQEFKIKNGNEVVVKGEKLRIKFRSVKQDSRCPTGVSCVWAGNAEIVIETAKKKKKPVVAVLNTALEPKQLEYRGFRIKLLALNPHPKANVTIDPKEYEAVLVVTKE